MGTTNKTDNPWLGFQTYQEIDARKFKGRSIDIKELYNLVKNNPIVVCYADSGIGKSSLINAGLCPLLKKEQLFPIKVEVADDCLTSDETSLDVNIIDRINASIKVFNNNEDNKKSKVSIVVENDVALQDPFLKKIDDAIGVSNKDKDDKKNTASIEAEIPETPPNNSSVDISRVKPSSLWWYLHTRVFFINISGLKIRLTPFLIFDQFEEIFYKANSLKQTEKFFRWFRNVSMTTPSAEVLRVYEEITKNTDVRQKVDIPNANPLKSLFSLRREYMANLDYWTSQKMTFPSFQTCKYCLMPLNKEQALEVITGQNTDKLNSISETIIHGLDPKEEAIPSILLSVICHELYKTNPLPVEINFDDIILTAYNNVIEMNDDTIDNEKVIFDIERIERLEDLLTDSRGKRQQIPVEDSMLLESEYDYLIKKHVIKETANGGKIELVHDKLAEVIRSKVQLRQLQRDERESHLKNLRFNNLQRKKMENVLTISGRELFSNYIDFGNNDNARQSFMSSITQFRFDYGERKRNVKSDFTSLSQLLDDTNSKYNHVCISFSDKDGNRCPSLDGIFEIEATIEKIEIQAEDSSGKSRNSEMNFITQVIFYDISHSKLINRYGFCGIQLSYDHRGNEIERTYIGKDLKRTNTTKCYSVVKREYDELGQVSIVKYFDRFLNPCVSWDGNHGYKSFYNSDGQEKLRTFFDIYGEDTCIRNGIYGQMFDYENPQGELSVITNVDIEHNPCCDINGYDRVLYHYDTKGRTNKIIFCDEFLNPVDKECGYAISTYGYDDLGQVSSVRFYNSKMVPVVSREDGIFGMIFEYNLLGQPIVTQCIDQFGNPMLNKNGYAFISRQFDEIGLEVSTKYLDVRRQPTYGLDNTHQTNLLYDHDSKLISEISFFDEKERLTQCKDGWARQVLYWDKDGREIIKYELYDEESNEPILIGEKKFQSGNAYICYETIRGELYEAKYKYDFAHRDIYYEPINNIVNANIHHYCYEYDNIGRKYKELYFSLDGTPCTDENGNYGIEIIYDSNGREIGKAFLDKNGIRTKNDSGVSVTIKKKGSDGIWEEYYDTDGVTPVLSRLTLSHKTYIKDDIIYATRDLQGDLCNSSWGYAYIKEWQDRNNPNVSFFAFYDSEDQPVLVNGWHKRQITNTPKKEILSYFGINNELVSPYGFAERRTITDTGMDVVNQIISYTDENGNPCDVKNPIDDVEISASSWFIRGEEKNEHVFYAINSKGKRVKGKFFFPYLKYLLWASLPLLIILFLIYEYILKPCYSLLINNGTKNIVTVPLFSGSIEKTYFWIKKKQRRQFVPVIIVEETYDQMPDMNSISENDYVKSVSSIKGLQKNDILLEYGKWKYDLSNPNTIDEFETFFNDNKDNSKSVTLSRIIQSENNEVKPEIIRFRVSGSLGVRLISKDNLYDKLSVSKLIDYAKRVKEEELKEVQNAILYTPTENTIQQSNVYRNIGFVYREDGQYNEAIENYIKAISLIESLPKYRKLDVSQLYFELSYCYYCLEHYEKSTDIAEKAILSVSGINEGWYISNQYKKVLIQYYIASNNYGDAKRVCKNYIDQICSIVNVETYADALDDMAFILAQTEEWKDAKEYEEAAIQQLLQNDIVSIELAQYYSRYSNILSNYKEVEDSILYLEKAIDIFKKYDLADKEANCWYELSVIYEKQGLYVDAEKKIRQAISLTNEDSQQSINIQRFYKDSLRKYLLAQNKFDEILFTAINEGMEGLPIKIELGVPYAIFEWGDWNISQNKSFESALENNCDKLKHIVLYNNGTLVELNTEDSIEGFHIQSQYFDQESKKYILEQYSNWLNSRKK